MYSDSKCILCIHQSIIRFVLRHSTTVLMAHVLHVYILVLIYGSDDSTVLFARRFVLVMKKNLK